MGSTFYSLHYQIVFSTKERRPMLSVSGTPLGCPPSSDRYPGVSRGTAVPRSALATIWQAFGLRWRLDISVALKGQDRISPGQSGERSSERRPGSWATNERAPEGVQHTSPSGRRGEAQKIVEELKEQAKQRHVTPYWIAMIYVGLGEKDEAFTWLEKAFEERSFWLQWFKTDPMLDSLRSDPRYRDLLRRIGFPP